MGSMFMRQQSSIPSLCAYPSMSITGIQGHLLEVTVVGCNKLKDTEWFSRQDPYVCLEYASTKYRTRTCTDGGKHPTFQEKFVFTLIEGLRELNVVVWNSNTISYDDFIGSGKVQLQKVLSQGYDDSPWPLQTKTGRHAGEVRLILHYGNANKSAASHAPSAPPHARHAPSAAPHAIHALSAAPHSIHALSAAPHSIHALSAAQHVASYVPKDEYSAPPPYPYPEPATAYPAPSPYPSYPPNPAAYPASPYPPPQTAAYPPQPYPPPSAYPPQQYPPPPQASPCCPPGPPYAGLYPPPPY